MARTPCEPVPLWLKKLARPALTPCGSHARAARTLALLCVLCTSAFKVCSTKEKTGLVSQGMAEEAGEFE